MRRVLYIFVIILSLPTLPSAQVEIIGLYPHPFPDHHSDGCLIPDVSGQLTTVYVIHENSPGATASEFKIQLFNGVNMILIEEIVTPPYIHIGSALTGIAIAYGYCVETWHPSYPNVILKLVFMGTGESRHCSSFLQVVPDPAAHPPGIYVTDCADTPNLKPIVGAWGVIVTTGDYCGCDLPVPTEETTWGKVKALY